MANTQKNPDVKAVHDGIEDALCAATRTVEAMTAQRIITRPGDLKDAVLEVIRSLRVINAQVLAITPYADEVEMG